MPESIMPAYGWLVRTALRIDDLALHLAALRKVGVPYTDEMIANAVADAYGHAAPDTPQADCAAARSVTASCNRAFHGAHARITRLDAILSYLQSLRLLSAFPYDSTATPVYSRP